MTLSRTLTALAVGLALAAPTLATAQDRAMQGAIKARQGQMQLYQLNLGVLGGMARGNIAYDAANAQAAADNIVALMQLDQRFLWPQGSDSASVEGTRAKAEIWSSFDDVIAKAVAANEAAAAMQAAAGQGQEAIGTAMAAIGQACTACHDTYRVEN